MFKRISVILIILLLTLSGRSTVIHLTNNTIDIVSFSKMLNGSINYDPYRALISLKFDTNIVEFFENKSIIIINSNFIIPSFLIQTNQNYYLSLSQVDYIISILQLPCTISNYSTTKNLDTTQENTNSSRIKDDNLKSNNEVQTNNIMVIQTNKTKSDTTFLPIKFVIIDPGHGGKDPGAEHNSLQEKKLTLEFSKKIYELLSRNSSKDTKVILTRNSDIYLTLEERVKIANNLLKQTGGYGIFISIHMNASPIKSKKGTEVYFISDKAVDSNTRETLAFENAFIEKKELQRASELEKIIGKIRSVSLMEESRILSEKIGDQLKKIDPGLKIKGGPFYVIKYIPVPSVLLEVEYLSNPESAKLLTNSTYQEQVAEMIANGIYNFISNYNETSGFTFSK